MSLQPILFPIDQPIMPEERQIGRKPSIDRLEGDLAEATHQWLIGERRIGKTSVAKAVLARLRKRGSVALEVDLSRLDIVTATDLAGELARQGQAARAGTAETEARKYLNLAKGQRGRARDLAKALEQAGFEDQAQALGAVSALLAGADDGKPGLGHVLGALSLHARATEHHAYVLLDEVHLLAELEGAEQQVASACHEPDSPIVFVFAGSEESAAQALRDEGRPLGALGREFELAQIAHEEWVRGLGERFAAAEVEIANAELDTIVQASGGHPRRTMLIASIVNTSASRQPDAQATPTLVELAVRDAQRDRSWG